MFKKAKEASCDCPTTRLRGCRLTHVDMCTIDEACMRLISGGRERMESSTDQPGKCLKRQMVVAGFDGFSWPDLSLSNT
jgi:hypothetical protein